MEKRTFCFSFSFAVTIGGLQEKQEAEKAAAQPSCIPGYFDPTSISVCIPTADNVVTFAAR